MASIKALLFVLTVATTVLSSIARANDTTSPRVTALLALIRPGADEDPFATIPWQTNLWEARKLAAKEGKPILLWEMDGNPLGCG